MENVSQNEEMDESSKDIHNIGGYTTCETKSPQVEG